MRENIDKIIVVAYLVIVIVLSVYYRRKYRQDTEQEFLTGGRHMNWFQTGMSLIGMMFDPGIMGNTAFGFVWGFYIVQWNAVNIWFTAPIAALFFVSIYWRSKITTTTEYLEKRFNYASRAVFSVIMSVMLISWLAYGVYMGGVLLNNFLGWDRFTGSVLMIGVTAFIVIFGGVRTMLSLSIIQTFLLIAAILGVGIAGFYMVGGFPGIREMTVLGRADTPIKSLMPPMHFSVFSPDLYPFPSVPTWCIIAGMSWIICNFSMAQRLLAAKDESHAQKSLIMAGLANALILLLAYAAGVAMRKSYPDINPDDAFMQLLLKFPVGVKGFLLVGLIAALFASKSGLLSASGSLLVQDIYARIIKKDSSPKHLTLVTRVVELAIAIGVLFTLPIFLNAADKKIPAYELIQIFMGDVMGVIIAIFLLGIFSKRVTAWASFYGVIIAVAIGGILHYGTTFYLNSNGVVGGVIIGGVLQYGSGFTGTAHELNFWVIGTLEFALVILIGWLGSYLERPKPEVELRNLTVWTLDDVKGPWVGLKSWPALKWWVIGLPALWFAATAIWEIYMKT
jgi:SSS family solute:Na+ symporter